MTLPAPTALISYEVHTSEGAERFGWDYERAAARARSYRDARCDAGQDDGDWRAIVVEVEDDEIGRFERDMAGYLGRGSSYQLRHTPKLVQA